mmetsp:Transcript_45633/g.105933  ORF Transcript_45633/g.105933 Transcript_45633/m.105933 type:complete len:210 (+) Transcript_45633:701-1330(+)
MRPWRTAGFLGAGCSWFQGGRSVRLGATCVPHNVLGSVDLRLFHCTCKATGLSSRTDVPFGFLDVGSIRYAKSRTGEGGDICLHNCTQPVNAIHHCQHILLLIQVIWVEDAVALDTKLSASLDKVADVFPLFERHACFVHLYLAGQNRIYEVAQHLSTLQRSSKVSFHAGFGDGLYPISSIIFQSHVILRIHLSLQVCIQPIIWQISHG